MRSTTEPELPNARSGLGEGATKLSADVPLSDPSMDLLGHAPFAKALAASLSAIDSTGGLVVALHGPWGSGKTTILRFVKHYLAQQLPGVEPPIVVDFSPWWFSGQQDLTQRFLDQLAGHLKNERVSADTIRALGEFTDALGELPIPWVSSLLKIGAKLLKAVREARQKILRILKNV